MSCFQSDIRAIIIPYLCWPLKYLQLCSSLSWSHLEFNTSLKLEQKLTVFSIYLTKQSNNKENQQRRSFRVLLYKIKKGLNRSIEENRRQGGESLFVGRCSWHGVVDVSAQTRQNRSYDVSGWRWRYGRGWKRAECVAREAILVGFRLWLCPADSRDLDNSLPRISCSRIRRIIYMFISLLVGFHSSLLCHCKKRWFRSKQQSCHLLKSELKGRVQTETSKQCQSFGLGHGGGSICCWSSSSTSTSTSTTTTRSCYVHCAVGWRHILHPPIDHGCSAVKTSVCALCNTSHLFLKTHTHKNGSAICFDPFDSFDSSSRTFSAGLFGNTRRQQTRQQEPGRLHR